MTATRAALLELATRVERASGPDHVLDAHIHCAVRGYTMHEDSDPSIGIFAFWTGDPWQSPCINCSSWSEVTASLDAALTLVRSVKCFIAALGDIAADGLPGCCLCVSTDPVHEIWGIALGGGDPDGKLARATVSAALRALAAEAPQ